MTKKESVIEIEYLTTLRDIMETYQEIAAARMQRIRSSVLQTRDYLIEVSQIFQQVKSSYKKEVEKLMKNKKDKNKNSFIQRNGKNLIALISSNTGLYGDLVKRTSNAFLTEYKKQSQTDNKPEAAIVGRFGLQFFKESFPNTPFLYFDMPDNKIDPESFKDIIASFVQYESVLVFYEQFQNVITQIPVATSISGDPIPSAEPIEEIKYFFEPSLSTILEFFEKEIFASIFEQTIYESHLAKFASRMIALNTASDNTNSELKTALIRKERIRHNELNKKQAELLVTQVLIT